MFRGSIPNDLQRIIKQHVSDWQVNDIYIGCSGNLTVERTLAPLGLRLHGNDILLYSAAIGTYLAGALTPYTISDYGNEQFPWLEERFTSDEERLATLLIMSRLAMAAGKQNAYYDRLRKAHRAQWSTLMDKTIKKIRQCNVRLASFAPQDVQTWIDQIPKNSGVISYPPFFAGDYESQFAKLEQLFDWPEAPTWVELNQERVEALFVKIADRKEWMLGVNRPIDFLANNLKGVAQTTNRGVPIFVYGNKGKPRLVQPNQRSDFFYAPHLQPGEMLGDSMKLVPLTEGQFSALRSLYMNPHIKPGSATLPLAVVVDKTLVGVFALSMSPTLANWDLHLPGPHVYLLSDFPVANTSYRHLAKLVLYAALSQEAKALCERTGNKRYRALTTTAFTSRPVSMKYRGVLKLLKRKENENVSQEHATSSEAYYAQRYELQYGNLLGQWTLDEGLALWKQKHGALINT